MIYLVRFSGDMTGVKGMLFLPTGWNCCTLEPPWLNNEQNRSCIPSGIYDVKIVESAKRGLVYEVQKVPNRTSILFHSGNYAGDEESGYKADSDGCILLGRSHDVWDGQSVVTASRETIYAFMNTMSNKPFRLSVKGEPPCKFQT